MITTIESNWFHPSKLNLFNTRKPKKFGHIFFSSQGQNLALTVVFAIFAPRRETWETNPEWKKETSEMMTTIESNQFHPSTINICRTPPVCQSTTERMAFDTLNGWRSAPL